jgi:hypothetical protein
MAVLWTITILSLCWLPFEWLQGIGDETPWFEIPDLDKLIHWGIFVAFSVLWVRLGASRWRYAWVGLGGLALAVVSETVQNLPWINRDGNLGDTISDVIGIAIGLAVAPWIEPLLRSLEAQVFQGSKS